MESLKQEKQQTQKRDWEQEIRACRSSGMSVLSWCREKGIKPRAYYYHRKILRERLCEQIPIALGTVSGSGSSAKQVDESAYATERVSAEAATATTRETTAGTPTASVVSTTATEATSGTPTASQVTPTATVTSVREKRIAGITVYAGGIRVEIDTEASAESIETVIRALRC